MAEYVQIQFRTTIKDLEARLDKLMQALVDVGVPDADITANLEEGIVTISALSSTLANA